MIARNTNEPPTTDPTDNRARICADALEINHLRTGGALSHKPTISRNGAAAADGLVRKR